MNNIKWEHMTTTTKLGRWEERSKDEGGAAVPSLTASGQSILSKTETNQKKKKNLTSTSFILKLFCS